ncbi:MAG: hypothetical protein ACHQ7M_06090 [Chloroflexota bacterium]
MINGHFDGTTESGTPAPRQELHKRLPHGDWVSPKSGLPVTHDVYRLSTDSQQTVVYNCVEQAIEKSTWLILQKRNAEAAKTA